MKTFFGLFIMIMLSAAVYSQNIQRFVLTVGTSMNDQAEKKFTYEEREWKLNGKQLIYNIDAHNKRYSDTLELQDSIVNKLSVFIKENKLLQDYEIKLQSSFQEKYEYNEFIHANFISDGTAYDLLIKAEGYGQIDVNKVALKLKELEQILYKAVE